MRKITTVRVHLISLFYRSFLYYLDGNSLLLKPVNIMIKPLIDHVSISDVRIHCFVFTS